MIDKITFKTFKTNKIVFSIKSGWFVGNTWDINYIFHIFMYIFQICNRNVFTLFALSIGQNNNYINWRLIEGICAERRCALVNVYVFYIGHLIYIHVCQFANRQPKTMNEWINENEFNNNYTIIR